MQHTATHTVELPDILSVYWDWHLHQIANTTKNQNLKSVLESHQDQKRFTVDKVSFYEKLMACHIV